MNKLAPILLFTYKRIDTLEKTIETLKNNFLAKESELFIFSDSYKGDKDKEQVTIVREYIKKIEGFKSITIFESVENKGLANSIIQGVTRIIDKYERVIVLEDDLETSRNFLSYMNFYLDKYYNEQKIFSISGYSFNLGDDSQKESDVYFFCRGWSWGWATWKNRWMGIDWEVKDYDDFIKDKNKIKLFSQGGSDLNAMLKKQKTNKLDSWAIRWFYWQFKVGGLTVYPILSKVFNGGFREDATHTKGSNNRYIPKMDILNKTTFSSPMRIEEESYFKKKVQQKMGIKARIYSKILTYLEECRYDQLFKKN